MEFVTRQNVLVKGFGVDDHLIRGAEVLKDNLALAANEVPRKQHKYGSLSHRTGWFPHLPDFSGLKWRGSGDIEL